MMEMKKVELVIEKGEKGLWGSVTYNDNLITDQAPTLPELENQIKNRLKEFEDVDPETVAFERTYDVFALFQEFDFLNISKVAKYADINSGLLRQYASGVKYPSLNQAKKIEETLHRLAAQMQKVSVYAA